MRESSFFLSRLPRSFRSTQLGMFSSKKTEKLFVPWLKTGNLRFNPAATHKAGDSTEELK